MLLIWLIGRILLVWRILLVLLILLVSLRMLVLLIRSGSPFALCIRCRRGSTVSFPTVLNVRMS
jgi:hypothetical protein